MANTPPEGRNDITGHLDEALSWIKGKHEFRFGGEFRQAQVDEFYQRHSVGSFVFNGGYRTLGDRLPELHRLRNDQHLASNLAIQAACKSPIPG